MLEVKKLIKSYKTDIILRSVDMSIDRGDVVSLIGPSGAGKTTLLRCMNLLERADSGELIFDDDHYDLRKISRRQIHNYRLRTSFVFQDYNLFSNKTAIENITEGLVIARGIERDRAEAVADEALARVGLSDYANHYPGQLSGGQSQRVAIARAFATEPEIIFFDEPTSALDPEITEEVLSVIRDLAADGMTMLIVTHETDFARSVSNKVYFMEDGHIVESGETEKIFTTPAESRTAKFLGITTQYN